MPVSPRTQYDKIERVRYIVLRRYEGTPAKTALTIIRTHNARTRRISIIAVSVQFAGVATVHVIAPAAPAHFGQTIDAMGSARGLFSHVNKLRTPSALCLDGESPD